MMMKRRTLLAMAPAAAALWGLRAQARPIPTNHTASPAGFAIAVQCWSFNRFTLFEAIEKSAAAGADAVELYPGQKLGGPHGDLKMGPDLKVDVYQSILDQCAKHGVIPVNFGVTEISRDATQARPLFEMAKTLGLYGITTESIDAIDTIEKLAKEYDVKVCFHNHPRPTKLWNPETVWNAVKDRHANIGFCADIGHWASSGMDPLEVVKKVASRILSFHFKDRESIEHWTHDRPYGTGVINLPAILDEVRQHGFAGNVSIEYEHHWEKSLPEIAQCVGYLRAYAKLRP